MRYRKIICLNTFLFFLLFAGAKSAYTQQVLQEKIFVHTDRNYYHTGEIMWFSIYDVDGKKFTSLNISRLAYTEIIDTASKPVLQGKIKLDNGFGNGSFIIPTGLPTGTYTFRCYTNWMKNFSPGLYYQKQVAIVNAANGSRSLKIQNNQQYERKGSLNITVEPDKQQYEKRQKITLSVSTTDSSDHFLPSTLSVSVYRLDSLISPDPSDIYSSIENDTEIAILENFPYPPEIKGHFIKGRMINSNTRMPSKRVTGYLTVMDDGNSFYNGVADNNGQVNFLVTKLNPSDSIIIQTHPFYHRDHKVDLESPFSDKFSEAQPSLFSSTDAYPVTMQEQSINAQVNHLYYDDQLNRFVRTKKDSIPFYYKEDAHYVLDDYTRFSRMEDVFREYVRPVGVFKRQGSFHLTVYNSTNRFLIDQEPLVLVDGVPVFDINTLFNYDPLKIKTIDVVTEKYFRSGDVFPGIISMNTFRGRTDGQLIDPNASVLPYEIVQKQRLFYSPAYDKPFDAHLPDFRTLLYWNPSIRTDVSGRTRIEFYSSDLDGEFVIQVHGLTANGKAGSVIKKFKVKSQQ